jgi:two-component system, chemotaxis family, response regulator Rcp1
VKSLLSVKSTNDSTVRHQGGMNPGSEPAKRMETADRKMQKPVVLIIEDNPSDVLFVREALNVHRLPVQLVVLDNGEKAFQWIDANDREPQNVQPSAVILDLNMPRKSGAEVLQEIRASEQLKQTPVIIFTSSNTDRDKALAERYPHTRYVRKSADLDEFMEIGHILHQVIQEQTADNRDQ